MKGRIEQALADTQQPIATFLAPIVLADDFDATLSPDQFNQLLSVSKMSDADLRIALLPLAAAFAYVPISKFYVGALARGLSGRIYFGGNMEFSKVQMGQTIHAEQAAISHAWIKGEEGIHDITVNYSPCGHCRQFMNELTTAKSLMIQLPKRDANSLQYYLPESFGPADLGITTVLMHKNNHGYSCEDSNPLVQSAVSALNTSYAPYSENLSGVALQSTSGKCYLGAYAENAAFNPSLPPLQVALIQMRMAGESFDNIEAAALAELNKGSVSHLVDTKATLASLNPQLAVNYIAL
ncbi:MAG: cytidine deaminase [Vibrio sp.]|uniref:cytidine deaminase n=1 Tax=Vibrio sp. TaxID=678 RepID=UPI003A895787